MTANEMALECSRKAAEEAKNFHLYNALVYHHPKGEVPYVSLDTPEGEFRIYAEMEEGFHGFYASFIKRGQTIEQDICMAELDPDNSKQFSVKVWSNPQSEEYQENIRFGRYIETHCPYCGSDKVEEVDSLSRTRYGVPEEIKYLCHNCEKDFLFDTERETYATRNRIPLTPNRGVAKR